MKKLLILLAVIGLAAPVSALAQQAVTAKVVATCGNQSYPAGSSQAVTQDTTGASCSSGGGGGGGNASVGPNGSPGPADSTQIGSVDGGGNLQPASTTNPIPTSVSSLPLPSGAATSALQTTGNTSLATIATNSGSAIPAGAAIIGKVGIDQSTPGTTNGVQVNAALPAGANTVGGTVPRADTSSGVTGYGLQTAAATNSTLVSTGAHTLYGISLESTSTTAMFLRMYDSAGAPTCSSATGFQRSWAIPPAASAGLVGGAMPHIAVQGIKFTSGLAFCVTGGVASTDNTNATTGGLVNLDYQ